MKTSALGLILFLTLFCSVAFVGIVRSTETDRPSDANKFSSGRISKEDLTIELPSAIFKGRTAAIKIRFNDIKHRRLKEGKATIVFIVNGTPQEVAIENGQGSLNHLFNEHEIYIYADDFLFHEQIRFTNLWLFLLPALALLLIFIGIRYRKEKV
ncbi:MAG: hypothetical protein ACHQRM_07715 [Bacteroidia bacterium]